MGTWRLLLAWLVIADHTPGLRQIVDLEIGKIAVCTFFFVSGFLMPLTFNSHYHRYGWLGGARRFYLNRFLRIYPIYWAALVATLLAVGFYGPGLLEHAASVTDLERVRTYLQNVLLLGLNQTFVWGGDFRLDPPAWTLDVELQYYALVPLLLLLGARRRPWLTLTLIGLGGVSAYLFFRPTQVYGIDRSLLAWSLFFLLGYGFYFSPALQSLALRKRWLIAAIAALLVLARLSRFANLTTLLVTLAFIAVSAALLVLQQNRGFGALDRLFGDLSYPTYILHWICVELMARWVDGHFMQLGDRARFPLLLALNVLISSVAAYAGLRLIGDPIESLRRRIRDMRRNPARGQL
jgi:peptidoglycan/LPS O-acetylase OafA/YrhL